MNNVQKKTIEQLNKLIVAAEDGKEGYRNASENVEDVDLKAVFTKLSLERGQYANQLRHQVNLLGGEAETDSSLLGSIFRAWMDVKSTLTSGDRDAVINACITGEESALADYRNVLEDNELDVSARRLVSDQLAGIERALYTIKSHRMVPAR